MNARILAAARPTSYVLLSVSLLWATGCCFGPREARRGPPYDRPFPLGQVTDAHWETQQTNAEASDFIFYDHEFVGETAKLNPAAKEHLLSVALRLPHVPFPLVVEQSVDNKKPQLDAERRQAIVDMLVKLGYEPVDIDPRVVVAPAIAPGLTAIETESAYRSTIGGDYGGYGGGGGRRFGGYGGSYR
jgi:hypothetical protein